MSTHFFWAPHPDDETIGMGGHIAQRARVDGPRPMVLFVFDARPSARQVQIYTGKKVCPWHGVAHQFAQVTAEGMNLSRSRRIEANRAVLALGADFTYLDIPEEMVSDDFGLACRCVDEAVQRYAGAHPDAVHHFPAGPGDVHAGLGTGHRSHEAVWRAGRALEEVQRQQPVGWMGPPRVLFHQVYAYTQPPEQRGLAIPLSDVDLATKRRAMDEYRRWDPTIGQLAYGYHSVPELFDAAAADAHEYLEMP